MSYVAGIGKINVDLLFGGLNRLPEEGEELYSESFGIYLGGGTPATAVNLSRLGVPVHLATFIGTDMFSSFAEKELNSSGVKLRNMYERGTAVNVTAAMLTKGDRTFMSYGEEQTPDYGTLLDEFSSAKIVIMAKGDLGFYRELKRRGVTLVCDFGYDENMSVESYRDYLEIADYYVFNRKEAQKITGKSSHEEAARVLSAFFDKVIIKLDADGAYLYESGKGKIFPSEGVECKDATGAGDAFLSGFVYGLYHDFDIGSCIIAGNLTGGKCVTEKGCLTAYYTEKEFSDRMKTVLIK